VNSLSAKVDFDQVKQNTVKEVLGRRVQATSPKSDIWAHFGTICAV